MVALIVYALVMLSARIAPAGPGGALNAAPLAAWSGKSFSSCGRTRACSGVVIVAPIIQLTMLGYAATTDVKDVPVVVADGDRSPESRTLIARFDVSRQLHRDRHGDHRGRGRSVSAARPRVDCAGDPAGLRRARSTRACRSRCRWWPTGATRTRRPWRSAMRRRWSASYADELMPARRRLRARHAADRLREFGSGSTRSSRAGSS